MGSRREAQEAEEELAYWKELATLLGWRVIGWTGHDTCLYDTGRGGTLDLTDYQRDAIVNAIKAAAGE